MDASARVVVLSKDRIKMPKEVTEMKGIMITIAIICSLSIGMRGYAQESPDLNLLVFDHAESRDLGINNDDDCARTLARLIDKGHRIREIESLGDSLRELAVDLISLQQPIILYSLTAHFPPTSVVVACNLFSECDDGVDNDADGTTDCDDSDCADFPLCPVAK